MKFGFLTWRPAICAGARAGLFAGGLVIAFVFLSAVEITNAQQKITKRFPGGKNVRVELRNISGTVVVEAWDKDEIRLAATIESKNTHIVPKQVDQCLSIDVMSDNRGHGDIGVAVRRPAAAAQGRWCVRHLVRQGARRRSRRRRGPPWQLGRHRPAGRRARTGRG